MTSRLKPLARLIATMALLPLLAPASPVLAADNFEVSLEDLLDTKVTTASKFSQRTSEAPSSVTVIRGEEILSHGWRNLDQVLGSVPGFQTTRGTDYHFLGVRGFAQPGDYNSRILLLIDGIPTNDGIYDQAMIGPEFPLDMSLVERVEVVPGPGSALYGGNAYLAVVNVITRPSDSVARAVTLGVGSGGLRRGQVSAGGRSQAGQHWLVSASTERSAGTDIYFPQWQGIAGSDGWARDMDGERLRRVFLRVGNDDWNLHLFHGRRQKEASGAQYGADFLTPGVIADATTQIGLRFQKPLNATWAFQGHAFWGEYRYDGSYNFNAQPETDNARSGWLGANAQLTGKPWDNQTWVVGASIRDDYRRAQETVDGVVNGRRSTLSLYAQDEIRFNDMFTLNLGGRYDRDTLDSRQVSPRAALLVNLPAATVLKLMAGKAFRPPNAYETDYTYSQQLAGGHLQPERIATREVALEQAIGRHGRWTASMYRNDFKDLLGVVNDFATGLQQIQTIGNASTEGIELGVRYRFDSGLDIRTSLSRQRSADSAGAPLPNTPAQLMKLLAVLPLGGYELGWETYYTGPRNDIFGTRVGGQAVSHVALSGHVTRDLRWQVRLTNVFDRNLASVVGGEYSLGPAGNVPTISDKGRQLQLFLTVHF